VTLNSAHAETSSELRLEYVQKFLQVYERAVGLPPHKRATFKQLFEGLGPYTTTFGQCDRLLGFLSAGGARLSLEHLFHQQSGARTGLSPTDDAHRLYMRLKVLADLTEDIRQDVRALSSEARPQARIGCPQIIGVRLLSFPFSVGPDVFGESFDLEPVFLPSEELVYRLEAGLLDLVIGYGPNTDSFFLDPKLRNVAFRSLGYRSRMALLAHPYGGLLMKDEAKRPAAMKSKSKSSKSKSAGPTQPTYDDLMEAGIHINLNDVDIPATKLIGVPSWNQPPALENQFGILRLAGRLREVQWYDDALALVRCGKGVTVAPEVYCQRERILAFPLEPVEDYTRWIGAYWNVHSGVPEAACRVAAFVGGYLTRFNDRIRFEKPPALDDEGFPDFYKAFMAFDKVEKWSERRTSYFPVLGKNGVPSPTAKLDGWLPSKRGQRGGDPR
jgi:DNA-binding transcriptional LysR family regulator